MTHTPGPWTIDRDYRAGMSWNTHIVLERNPDHRICFMTSNGKEADARLIAAAPDMLAAIQDYLTAFDTMAMGLEVEAVRMATIRASMRAAIAKATEPPKRKSKSLLERVEEMSRRPVPERP